MTWRINSLRALAESVRIAVKARALKAIKLSRYGEKVTDKTRLLFIIALLLRERTLPGSWFGKNVLNLINNLSQKTTVLIDGVRYNLVDSESLYIVLEPESYTSLWLKPAKGENLIDIGAHIGKYTLSSARIVGPGGHILAIEANPNNFKKLEKNIEINNMLNVIALNIVAWNKEGKLKLFTGNFSGHHSTKINWDLGWHEVDARPIDNIVKQYNFGSMEWIKIDVEGAELEVLSSMKATISRFRPRIIVELSYKNLRKARLFMEQLGYGLVRISPITKVILYGTFRNFASFAFIPLNVQMYAANS